MLATYLLGAYAFSRCRFAGRRELMIAYLVVRMFPAVMIIIPLFILMRNIGLLDSSLGGQNGLDFLKAAQQWGNQVPIIIFSDQLDLQVQREAFAAGAAEYLVKPDVNHEGLRRALRHSLDRNRAAAAGRVNDRLFRAIFENAQDAMLIADAGGHFTEAIDGNLILVALFSTGSSTISRSVSCETP